LAGGEVTLNEAIKTMTDEIASMIFACQRKVFTNWANDGVDKVKDGRLLAAVDRNTGMKRSLYGCWTYKGAVSMNCYINLNRIEFTITDACSGRCKHCSNGERTSNGESINADAAVSAIKQLTDRFKIKSVMTFGGEPLLFAKTINKIHATARDCGIPKRQLITNGFFSKDEIKIDEAAKALCVSGVNDVLLSVDVFHQEFIPIEPVMYFAEMLLKHKAPSLRVQPAWVVREYL